MTALDALVTASADAGFHYRALQRRILLAEAQALAGQRPRAVAGLAALLPLADRAGMVRSLLDAGPLVEALLAEARAGTGAEPRNSCRPGSGTSQLVTQGLSNKAIARAAQVTPETVKWHLQQHLRKARRAQPDRGHPARRAGQPAASAGGLIPRQPPFGAISPALRLAADASVRP